MEWDGSLDECKASCLAEDNCKGFVYYEAGEDHNCYGKTDSCGPLEYEIDAGAVTYTFTRGLKPVKDMSSIFV